MIFKTLTASLVFAAASLAYGSTSTLVPFSENFTPQERVVVCDLYAQIAAQATIHRNIVDDEQELLEITQDDLYSTSIISRAYKQPKLKINSEIIDASFRAYEAVNTECLTEMTRNRKWM